MGSLINTRPLQTALDEARNHIQPDIEREDRALKNLRRDLNQQIQRVARLNTLSHRLHRLRSAKDNVNAALVKLNDAKVTVEGGRREPQHIQDGHQRDLDAAAAQAQDAIAAFAAVLKALRRAPAHYTSLRDAANTFLQRATLYAKHGKDDSDDDSDGDGGGGDGGDGDGGGDSDEN